MSPGRAAAGGPLPECGDPLRLDLDDEAEPVDQDLSCRAAADEARDLAEDHRSPDRTFLQDVPVMAGGGESGAGRRVVDGDLSLRKDTGLGRLLRRHPDGRLVTEARRRREPDADRARIDRRHRAGKRDGRGAIA
jgi:hypothetical protein